MQFRVTSLPTVLIRISVVGVGSLGILLGLALIPGVGFFCGSLYRPSAGAFCSFRGSFLCDPVVSPPEGLAEDPSSEDSPASLSFGPSGCPSVEGASSGVAASVASEPEIVAFSSQPQATFSESDPEIGVYPIHILAPLLRARVYCIMLLTLKL